MQVLWTAGPGTSRAADGLRTVHDQIPRLSAAGYDPSIGARLLTFRRVRLFYSESSQRVRSDRDTDIGASTVRRTLEVRERCNKEWLGARPVHG